MLARSWTACRIKSPRSSEPSGIKPAAASKWDTSRKSFQSQEDIKKKRKTTISIDFS